MGWWHYIQDMSRIQLKYHTNVLFYTKYRHPTLICRGTDACTHGRTHGRTDRKYLLNIQGWALAPRGARIVFFWKSNFTPRLCIVCLPIMMLCIGAWSPGLYLAMSGWRRTFLLAEYSTKEISMSPTLSVTKVSLEVPHNWGTTRFTTEMHLLDPFFHERMSPLDPESSRTLIVLFLTFNPELTLKSGVLVQSEHVFLLFSSKLVQFSSNFFNLGTNFFGIQPFIIFWEMLLDPRVFSSGKLAFSTFLARRLLISTTSAPQLASFFTKNAHYRDYRCHLTGFAVLIAISLASVVLLWAVLATLIGRGSIDE